MFNESVEEVAEVVEPSPAKTQPKVVKPPSPARNQPQRRDPSPPRNRPSDDLTTPQKMAMKAKANMSSNVSDAMRWD